MPADDAAVEAALERFDFADEAERFGFRSAAESGRRMDPVEKKGVRDAGFEESAARTVEMLHVLRGVDRERGKSKRFFGERLEGFFEIVLNEEKFEQLFRRGEELFFKLFVFGRGFAPLASSGDGFACDFTAGAREEPFRRGAEKRFFGSLQAEEVGVHRFFLERGGNGEGVGRAVEFESCAAGENDLVEFFLLDGNQRFFYAADPRFSRWRVNFGKGFKRG